MEDIIVGNLAVTRLDALEMRVAHQDQVVEDLNTIISAQWAAIEDLKCQMAALSDRLAEAEDRGATLPPAQKPPHY